MCFAHTLTYIHAHIQPVYGKQNERVADKIEIEMQIKTINKYANMSIKVKCKCCPLFMLLLPTVVVVVAVAFVVIRKCIGKVTRRER